MKRWLFPLMLSAAILSARAEQPDGDRPPPPPPEAGDDFAPPHEGPEGQPGMPPPVQILMQHWQKENPEEFARMKKLREEDPQAFRAELHRKLQEARKARGGRRMDGEFVRPGGGPGGDFDPGNPQMKEAEDKIRDLAQAWRSAPTEEEKQKVKTELVTALNEAFDVREQVRRERLAQMEKKLAELRTSLEQRTAQRQAIIEKRLNELTEGEKLVW